LISKQKYVCPIGEFMAWELLDQLQNSLFARFGGISDFGESMPYELSEAL